MVKSALSFDSTATNPTSSVESGFMEFNDEPVTRASLGTFKVSTAPGYLKSDRDQRIGA